MFLRAPFGPVANIFYDHSAGKDLTPELGDAPHGEEVFVEMPLVGELK